MPGLNTASLPDLIFTVLFFFMIVTQMRHDEVKVRLVEPDGTQLTKLQQKASAIYIYVGSRVQGSEGYAVQIDNELVGLDDVLPYLVARMKELPKEQREKVIVNLKADRDVPMNIIKQIREALKLADLRLVHFSANEKGKKD